MFLAHLVYQPKRLMQSCFVCCVSLLALVLVLTVQTSPIHRIIHRSFIFGTHVHLCPSYMYIKYLVILTCSFLNGSHFGTSLFCYPAHTDSHQDFMLHILMYPFFTFIHKRNNATVTFYLKFMSIFLKSTYHI